MHGAEPKLQLQAGKAQDREAALEGRGHGSCGAKRAISKLSSARCRTRSRTRSGWSSAIQTLRESHAAQRSVIQKADQDLSGLDPEISKAKSIYEDTRQRGETKEHKFSQEVDGIRNTVSELRRIDADIQDYIDRGGSANLTSNLRAIASLETSIAKLDGDIQELTAQANQLSKEIDNGDRQKKNIQDNINLRKSLHEVEAPAERYQGTPVS